MACPATDERILADLLQAARSIAPADLGRVVHLHARRLGAREAVVYLTDYEQQSLVPLPLEDVAPREQLGIDTTLPGRAFRLLELVTSGDDSEQHLWLPLVDGSDRIGVLEMVLDGGGDPPVSDYEAFASLVAELLVAKSPYGDTFTRVRRRREMTLAAEIQWQLLPPLTFTTSRVAISGMLEPSYEIGGDTFDYAQNEHLTHLAIIDAMGHGAPASVMSSVAIGSYRHSRRLGHDLAETYTAMDRALGAQFGPEYFVTGQFGELDTATGLLSWINAGHPLPLLLRRGSVIGSITCEPSLPVGFGAEVTHIATESLEPGDRLLFFSDGVIEARSPQGQFFGDDRLADLLERASAARLPVAETVRRLSRAVLEHQQGRLQDDATMVLLGWNGPELAGSHDVA